MDFKINLPTEDCTCDAKLFYDKYKKQVHTFIQNELEIARTTTTTDVVVGRKAGYEVKSTQFDADIASILTEQSTKSKKSLKSQISQKSLISEKSQKSLKSEKSQKSLKSEKSQKFLKSQKSDKSLKSLKSQKPQKSEKQKVRLPKIKGAKLKESGDEKSESISESTATTETHLPEIKVIKKWSDDLSSSASLEISEIKHPSRASLDDIKTKYDKRKAKKKETKLRSKKQIIDGGRKKETKPEIKKQLIDKGTQAEAKKQLQKKLLIDERQKEETESFQESQISDQKSSLLTDEAMPRSTLEYMAYKRAREMEKQKKKAKKVLQTKQVMSKGLIEQKRESWKKRRVTDKDSESSSSDDELSLSPFENLSEEEITKKRIDKILQRKSKSFPKTRKIHEHARKISSSEDEELSKTKKSHAHLRIASTSEDKESSSTYEYKTKEEDVGLQLRKTPKKKSLKSVLISRSQKEGHDIDFIPNILAKAKEMGQEEDLLFSLSNAKEEGTLDSLLFTMSEAMEKGEFHELATNLIAEGKTIRRKTMILNLIDAFNKKPDDHKYLASLVAKANEEYPDDEIAIILSKAIRENNLSTVLSNFTAANKKGKLDDMISVMVKKGKREEEKQLLSIVNSIAQEQGKDKTFIENLLSKAHESGKKDELISIIKKAKSKGNLEELVSTLADTTTTTSPENFINLLSSAKEIKPKKRAYTDLHLDDAFDEDFLEKWFAKVKTEKEQNLLLKKLSRIRKSGKSVDFSALTSEKTITDIDDLFAAMYEVLSSDEESESESESDSETEIIKVKGKTQKLLRHKNKPFKKGRKHPKDTYSRKRRGTAESTKLKDKRASTIRNIRRSVLDKMKQRILFRRQYSFGYTLPDVDYSLVERHKLSDIDLSVPDHKSDEEEHVTTPRLDRRISKHYRESFLKKIYGGRKIEPTPESGSAVTTSSSSVYVVRKRLPKPKPKIKKKTPVTAVTEKEPQPAPRKIKKHVVTYAKRRSFRRLEKEFTEDSDISSFGDLLDSKISRVCDLSGEERSEGGYIVGFRYKDDDENFDWRKPTKKASLSSTESFYSGEWMSRARRRAMIYFDNRKIEDFFHFLGSHLASDMPEDPIDYLIVLLENCINFRNGVGRAPLLFEQYHVENLYYSMDIFKEGFISLDQYQTGMETLFVKEFNKDPQTNSNNMVFKETFVSEALKGQRIQLRKMLRGVSIVFNPREKIDVNSTLGSVWSKIELYENA